MLKIPKPIVICECKNHLFKGTVTVACLPSISKDSLLQKYVFAIGWGLVNIGI